MGPYHMYFSAFNSAFEISKSEYIDGLPHSFKWTYSKIPSKDMFKAYRFYVEIASMTNANKYL